MKAQFDILLRNASRSNSSHCVEIYCFKVSIYVRCDILRTAKQDKNLFDITETQNSGNT